MAHTSRQALDSDFSMAHRLRAAKRAASTLGGATVSAVRQSRVLRWRYGASHVHEITIVPPELRTADPSVFSEIRRGELGLAGLHVAFGDATPFAVQNVSDVWARELLGFGWLRHLAAAKASLGQSKGHNGSAAAGQAVDPAAALAETLYVDFVRWIKKPARQASPALRAAAAKPDVTARRLISTLTHARLLLDAAEPRTYERITDALGADIIRLSATWRQAPPGQPRLLCLMALVFADICVDRSRRADRFQKLLEQELNRQVLADGGHVSRDPQAGVDILFDLLPLEKCFLKRERAVPVALSEARVRLVAMLRLMRLGDGHLARLNTSARRTSSSLAMVLAYIDTLDQAAPPSSAIAEASGYARITAGHVVVLADVGVPPAANISDVAKAGCLAFEFSDRGALVVVCGGTPSPAFVHLTAAARATASHSTLCLGETSSSELLRHPMLATPAGGAPIVGPFAVTRSLVSDKGVWSLDASHDGYRERFGLIHRRSLKLSADGRRLDGEDALSDPANDMRLSQDVPFAIHFHLAPEASVSFDSNANACVVRLASGRTWVFRCDGAKAAIEDSVFYDDVLGPRETAQIVVRGATVGISTVRWSFQVGR